MALLQSSLRFIRRARRWPITLPVSSLRRPVRCSNSDSRGCASGTAAAAEATPRPGLLGLPARRPVIFGAVVSAAKTCLSDGFVQLYVEQRDEIDWRRNVIFGKRSTGCDWQQQLV
jgi:hypothetical protein